MTEDRETSALDLTVRTLEDRPQQDIAAEYITLQKCLIEPGLNDVNVNKIAYLVIYSICHSLLKTAPVQRTV